MTLYSFVGPSQIAARVEGGVAGWVVNSPDDVSAWIRATKQDVLAGMVIATFVIDAHGRLRLADRRSEHVVCAGGEPVLSAGEMTFVIAPRIEVSDVSNQSTGYCPEPESWPVVAAALSQAGLPHPEGFTLRCTFRRCPACDSVNLVKEEVFVCALCAADLPKHANLHAGREC